MRIFLLVALMVGACADEDVADAPDAGSEPVPEGPIAWVEAGDYDVEWLKGDRLDCDALTISDGTLEMKFRCRGPFVGRVVANCRFFADGDRFWHLCPNVGHLFGELRDSDRVLGTFRAWPH